MKSIVSRILVQYVLWAESKGEIAIVRRKFQASLKPIAHWLNLLSMLKKAHLLMKYLYNYKQGNVLFVLNILNMSELKMVISYTHSMTSLWERNVLEKQNI